MLLSHLCSWIGLGFWFNWLFVHIPDIISILICNLVRGKKRKIIALFMHYFYSGACFAHKLNFINTYCGSMNCLWSLEVEEVAFSGRQTPFGSWSAQTGVAVRCVFGRLAKMAWCTFGLADKRKISDLTGVYQGKLLNLGKQLHNRGFYGKQFL